MRLNYWVGLPGTHYLVRHMLETDSRINKPTMPMYQDKQEGWDWFMKAMWESRKVDSVLSDIFYSTDKDECNIAFKRINKEENDYRRFLDYSPAGTRIWFFKFKTKEQFISNYNFLLNELDDQPWLKNMIDNNPKFSQLTEEQLVEKMHDSLDNIADRFMCGPWQEFTIPLYFNEEGSGSSDFLVRMFVK